jgi:DNA topoisomerase-2
MERRRLSWVPGLLTVFDGVLAAAVAECDPPPSATLAVTAAVVEVDIDRADGMIRVRCTTCRAAAATVEHVEAHEQVQPVAEAEASWDPAAIYGALRAPDGCRRDARDVTGVDLANIFSERFEVEAVRRGRAYRGTWSRNMRECSTSMAAPPPTASADAEFTQVTFWPDYPRFGDMSGLGDDDILQLMRRRVYDAAGTSHQAPCRPVFKLDGATLPVTTFREYVAMYPASSAEGGLEVCRIDRGGLHLEAHVHVSNAGCFQQVSFANGAATLRGGTHVNYVTDQVVGRVIAAAAERSPFATRHCRPRPYMAKRHLFVFVNCHMDSPTFDGPCKDALTTPREHFGTPCRIVPTPPPPPPPPAPSVATAPHPLLEASVAERVVAAMVNEVECGPTIHHRGLWIGRRADAPSGCPTAGNAHGGDGDRRTSAPEERIRSPAGRPPKRSCAEQQPPRQAASVASGSDESACWSESDSAEFEM